MGTYQVAIQFDDDALDLAFLVAVPVAGAEPRSGRGEEPDAVDVAIDLVGIPASATTP